MQKGRLVTSLFSRIWLKYLFVIQFISSKKRACSSKSASFFATKSSKTLIWVIPANISWPLWFDNSARAVNYKRIGFGEDIKDSEHITCFSISSSSFTVLLSWSSRSSKMSSLTVPLCVPVCNTSSLTGIFPNENTCSSSTLGEFVAETSLESTSWWCSSRTVFIFILFNGVLYAMGLVIGGEVS